MKKIIGILVIGFLLSSRTVSAQDEYPILMEYIPQKIEIMPNVYEMIGKSIGSGKDSTKSFFVISTDDTIVQNIRDTVLAGRSQIVTGPRVDDVIQAMIIADYEKVRKAVEKRVQDELKKAKGLVAKINAKKKLNLERDETAVLIARLKESIEKRKAQRTIYIYNHGEVPSSGTNRATPNLKPYVPLKNSGGVPPQPD